MKRVLAYSTAALLGASLLASPVLAQVSVDTNTGANVGIGADANSGTSGADATGGTDLELDAQSDTQLDSGVDTMIDTDTTAAINGSFDGALSSIGNSSATSQSISTMTEVSSVNVIRINELEGADMDALGSAETENSAQIEELRAAIDGNSSVNSALEAESVDVSSVVGADVQADGSLTVYVK